MQTRGARGGISGQVREARGRVRELAQTERAREQQQREREEQREDFPAKITSCPDLSSRQTPNNKVNIACGTIMPFDLVSSSRYAFNHTGGSR